MGRTSEEFDKKAQENGVWVPMKPKEFLPVPEQHTKTWKIIKKREKSERMVEALYRVIQGMSPASAATDSGFEGGSRTAVYIKAKSYGIYTPRAEKLAATAREVLDMSGENLVRLLAEPGAITPVQTGVLFGISQDKEQKRLEREKSSGSSNTGSIDTLVSRLIERGGSLEITVKRPDALNDAIDVTPSAPEALPLPDGE